MTLHASKMNAAADDRTPIGIEKLLEWTFGKERAELDPPRDAGVPIPSHLLVRSMFDAMATVAQLGVRIDTSGAGARFVGSTHVHWDAETTAAVVGGALDRRDAYWLVEHARAGTRPSWRGKEPSVIAKPKTPDDPESGWIVNQHGRTGRTEKAEPNHYPGGAWRPWMARSKVSLRAEGYLSAREAQHYQHLGRCCPIAFDPPPGLIASTREAYARWWTGLHKVREALIDGKVLKSHRLTREMPPATPWALVEIGERPSLTLGEG